jgi:hypothetical protein
MTTEQIVTLVIALYGAILATALGVREFRAEKRRISVILEYIAFYERAQLIVANVGHRPITISEIGMEIWRQGSGPGYWDTVPRGYLFASDTEPEHLPVTLGDGEHATLPLSEVVSRYLVENRMRAKVCVYDVEGKAYRRFTRRVYNPKWGVYSKVDH